MLTEEGDARISLACEVEGVVTMSSLWAVPSRGADTCRLRQGLACAGCCLREAEMLMVVLNSLSLFYHVGRATVGTPGTATGVLLSLTQELVGKLPSGRITGHR